MGDVGDFWRAFNEESKQHRTGKQEKSKELLRDLCTSNRISCVELQPWQIRLTKGEIIMDIYPQRQKYHLIKPTNKRGEYQDLTGFIKSVFKIN